MQLSRTGVWLLDHLGPGLFAALMLGGALTAVIRPGVIVRWARQAHPELREDDADILLLTRFIGLGGCVVAMTILFVMIRSFRG